MFYTRLVDRIGVRELNQNTSQVLARVSSGETIEITDRGRPVARIVPVDQETIRLHELVSSGRLIPPTAPGQFSLPPVYDDPDVDVGAQLEELRDEERW